MKRKSIYLFLVSVFAFLFLVSCNSNEKDNYSISDFTSLSDISNIWYFDMGYASNTIFITNKDNYDDVYSKFSDLNFKRNDEFEIEMPSSSLEFYKGNNSLIFTLIFSKNYTCIVTTNDEETLKYVADSSSEYYDDVKLYLKSIFNTIM